jgi:hypothetical protein
MTRGRRSNTHALYKEDAPVCWKAKKKGNEKKSEEIILYVHDDGGESLSLLLEKS